MGLLDRFGSDPDDDSDDSPDFYRVVKKTPKGGWKAVDGFDEMADPVDKDTFEYNASPLEPGEYRLFEVVDNLNRQPSSGVGWTLEVEGATKDTEQDGEIDELKREIRALRDDGSKQPTDDPQEAVERQKASLQLAALQSEEFLKKHGDKLVLSMFDSDGAGSGGSDSAIGYDDWQKNPIGASLFETMNMVREEPEQIERLGEAMGRGIGTLVGSAADGYADTDQSLAEVKDGTDDTPTQPDTDTDDSAPGASRNLDAGPSNIDDLGAGAEPADTNELAANIAEARTTARRAGPGEQDRPADAPHADPDNDDTDTPDPTPAPAGTDPTPEPDEPDHTDAASPDPDPMTASPDTDTTATEDRSSDNAAAEIAEGL